MKVEQVMEVIKSYLFMFMISLMTLNIVEMWELRDNKNTQHSLARLLPIALWETRVAHPQKKTASNWELPMPEDVHYADTYWQLLELAKGSIYLYAAYWDTRFDPQVIVIVYCDFIPLPELYCLLWYENDTKPLIVSASFTYAWLSKWGGPFNGVDEPYLVSCKVQHRPAAVSLVTAFCVKPTNVLSVQGSTEERISRPSDVPSIGVCLKWMRYDKDVSAILIEWIEILKALGANTIYIYVIKVHPNTERVLRHYSALGVIDVTPLILSPQRRSRNVFAADRRPFEQRQELLSLNDCLYRAVSSGNHEWLANIDLDEVIVPIRDMTWQELITRESKEATEMNDKVDAFIFSNYFFLDGAQRDRAAPLPAKILAHVWRATDPNPPDMIDMRGLYDNDTSSHTQPSLARLLPVALWESRVAHPERNTASIWKLPMPEDLHYATTYWQLLKLAKGSIYLYAAYWDTRFNPQVILLVYCDFTPLPELYCLLWYENETKPSIVSASYTYGWRPEWGGPIDGVDEPYLVSCKMQRRPAAVSLVTTFPIKPTNVLAVQGSREERISRSSAAPSIGVCVKWMQYDNDVSAILIEWIEVLKALGADTIYIYVIKVHPNTERVLRHYSALGVIDVTPLILTPQRRSYNVSAADRRPFKRRQEVISLNDCLYRAVSSGKHQWLANIDLDEVIVPIREMTWQELITQESEVAAKKYGKVDSLMFVNYFFLDGAQRDRAAPHPAKILAHFWRARNPSYEVTEGMFLKSFHNVSSVIATYNHYPIQCAEQLTMSRTCVDTCKHFQVWDMTARLHHYRVRCPYEMLDCPEMHDVERDDALARLHSIGSHVRDVLHDLRIPFNET